jgi:hypothetical protein
MRRILVNRARDRNRQKRGGGRRRWHGAADAEAAHLVGGDADHTARADADDDDRPAAQRGVVPLLDGGVEVRLIGDRAGCQLAEEDG